jgi:hypothetical protein
MGKGGQTQNNAMPNLMMRTKESVSTTPTATGTASTAMPANSSMRASNGTVYLRDTRCRTSFRYVHAGTSYQIMWTYPMRS